MAITIGDREFKWIGIIAVIALIMAILVLTGCQSVPPDNGDDGSDTGIESQDVFPGIEMIPNSCKLFTNVMETSNGKVLQLLRCNTNDPAICFVAIRSDSEEMTIDCVEKFQIE